MKRISVIVPIYKGNSYIPHMIRMLEDNWRNANKAEPLEIELVLVNDFPEEALNVETQWVKNISWISVTNERNRGIHFSRVQGLLHSSGSMIFFLDQDDRISPVYIKEQMNALGEYDAIICNGKNCSDLIYKDTIELHRAVNGEEYRNGYNWIISPGQVLLKRKAIPAEWIENILDANGGDDYFLWTMMFCKNSKIGIQDKVLYWHVITDENTSKNINNMNKSVFKMVDIMRNMGYLSIDEETKIKERRTERIVQDHFSVEDFEKEKNYKRLLELWMTLRERDIFVDKYFEKQGFKRVAIYGLGMFGKHLYYELKESTVQIACFIDQNKKTELEGVKTVAPGQQIDSVDVIVVTPFMEFFEIQEMLKQYYTCEIISINAVLHNADCELQEV